jgi:hypothetical protein
MEDLRKMNSNEPDNLLGCCGLYCGLCSKYQSKAPSRCVGCRLGEQHSWCTIWTCCVRKHGFETCAECGDVFRCPVFVRRRVEEWIPAAHNLGQIGESSEESLLREQKERQELLEALLQDYNEGRSAAFYCKVCVRMAIDVINKALDEAEERITAEQIVESDIKTKAKILKEALKALASESNVDLN